MRSRERRDALGRHAQEVIRGQGLHFDRELSATERREFIRVEMDLPTKACGISQQTSGLIEAEDAFFTKNIHRFGETATSDLRMDDGDQFFDPAFGVRAVLGWNLVGGEAGRVEIHWVDLVGSGDHLEHSHFGCQIEPVA